MGVEKERAYTLYPSKLRQGAGIFEITARNSLGTAACRFFLSIAADPRWICIHMYMEPYICACMHAYIRNILTYINICCLLPLIFVHCHRFRVDMHVHTFIHAYMYFCMRACMHAYMHTYIYTCMNACIHT